MVTVFDVTISLRARWKLRGKESEIDCLLIPPMCSLLLQYSSTGSSLPSAYLGRAPSPLLFPLAQAYPFSCPCSRGEEPPHSENYGHFSVVPHKPFFNLGPELPSALAPVRWTAGHTKRRVGARFVQRGYRVFIAWKVVLQGAFTPCLYIHTLIFYALFFYSWRSLLGVNIRPVCVCFLLT